MDEENVRRHTWNEYRRLILTELQNLTNGVSKLSDKLDGMNTQLSSDLNKIDKRVVILETKAGIIGAFGGILSVIVVEVIKSYF